ncbi:MAG: hypothetical protein ACFE9J_16110 [Candidatus Hermodarchaeota archaeon]
MIISYYLIIQICWFAIFSIFLLFFVRRVGRAFRRVHRRVGRGVGRTFRRVPRRIERTFRRVNRYQRQFSKTDPTVFNSIQNATSKSMKEYLDKNEWVKEKDLKNKIKNRVAIEIEKDVQESPMRDMRSLIENTIDETINLALLNEVKNRGDQLKITNGFSFSKLFWRIIFPLVSAASVASLSFIYPDKIPPGNLVVSVIQQPGLPPIIDPMQLIQSILINGVVYGIGILILVGLIILIRRR